MKSAKVKPKHTLKEILNKYLDSYLRDPRRKKYIRDEDLHSLHQVRHCQTAHLGLYCFECECCGAGHRIPRSCKHRFCSNCGSADTMKWIRKLVRRLPDIKYHHVVFTLPSKLRCVAKLNKELLYNLMFESSQLVIKSQFKDRYRLQAGIISVLHTNGSDLKYHPHIHQIVSSGGLNAGNELQELKGDYLFPQRVLAKQFRILLLSKIYKAYRQGGLKLPHRLQKGKDFNNYIQSIKADQWIVNVDKPIHGVEKIVAYVGRYTKKSCISERRLMSVADEGICLSYKDYKNTPKGEKPKQGVIHLSVVQFLDRLLEHLPLKGFKVVRYYGLFSSGNIDKIDRRYLIKEVSIEAYDEEELEGRDISECRYRHYRRQVYEQTGIDPLYCYQCYQDMELVCLRVRTPGGERVYEYNNSS